MKRGVKFCGIGLALISFVFAGMFLAKGSDSQERQQQSDRRIPIPVPNVLVAGRVLTDVGETPVAGALVRLEPVDRDIPLRVSAEGTDPRGSDGNPTQLRRDSSNGEPDPKDQADFKRLPDKKSGPDGPDRTIAPYPRSSLQAFTHGDGGFRIAAFPGKFIVRIEAHGFQTEYYDDVEDREDARRIELTPTTVPIKLLIKLKSVSTIAGTATVEGTVQPVPLGQVVANPEFRGIRRSGTIRPDGSYLIEGLSEGRYWIHGTARGFLPGTFVAEGSESERSIVTVRANSHVTGIDFILSRGLSFFGVVRVSETGTGLAGAIVTASRVNAREGLSQTAETESDGSYTMSGLVQGEYIVNARKAGYGFQLYPNTKDRRDAESVIVAEDLQPEGVDFSLSIVGTILGKVTAKDGGEPVQGAMEIPSGVFSRLRTVEHCGSVGGEHLGWATRCRIHSVFRAHPNANTRQTGQNSARERVSHPHVSNSHVSNSNTRLANMPPPLALESPTGHRILPVCDFIQESGQNQCGPYRKATVGGYMG